MEVAITTLPTVFVSHGAPTFALEPGVAGAKLRQLGEALPAPGAILIVSPHWTTKELRVTTAPLPSTIHDFRGFDPALDEIVYPAPGHPQLANRTIDVLQDAGWAVAPDPARGLDHGAWVPLLHMYPQADVPVFQVSMPVTLSPATALKLGQALAPLRDENVLIIGSGSLTHNLTDFMRGEKDTIYATEFADWVREAVRTGDTERLAQALEVAPHARRAHPTSEHYLPLLIAAGAANPAAAAHILEGGMPEHALVMDAFVFGNIS